MEFFEFENIEQVKLFFKIFGFFIIFPCVSWWWNFITGLFTTQYYEENNCCEHCHLHIDPEPLEDLYLYAPKSPNDSSGGGMAVPAMEIPQREPEYIEREW